MKFLLMTLEYFPFKGGVANYYTNLVYYWPKNSEISVLNNNNNELLKKRGLIKWSKALFELYSQVKKGKVDYVIVGNILPLGFVAYIVSRITGIKYAVVLHGMDFTWAIKKKRKKIISRLILKRADKIIAANSYVAELCKSFSDNKKIMVVNPGIKDFSDFNVNRENIREKNGLVDYKILFSLGRLVKRKGFDYTIRAVRKVLEERPKMDLIYVIAGKGLEENYLKKIAYEELGVNWEKYIKFIGEVSESEKWSLLSCCDIFIMPSRNIDGDFEGFGIVYLEANLNGKPVIAGRSGGVSDAVINKETGLLIDPENIEEIASAIKSLVNNPEERLRLGKNGRQRAISSFLWSDQIKKLHDNL